MDLKDPKALKRLADACRKAGIQSFKGFGVEFTLSSEAPTKPKRKVAQVQQPQGVPVVGPKGTEFIQLPEKQDEIETNSPTAEELLYWSVGEEMPTS